MGSIEDRSTVSDYHEDEKEHQVSIHTSLLRAEWQDAKMNMLDAPGYADFVSEALGALRVADFAVIVVHAQEGPGVGTDKAWRYATEFGIPKILVINHADGESADFHKVLAQLRERYGDNILPLSVPVDPGVGFSKLMDVMRTEVVSYVLDGSGKFEEMPAEGEFDDRVKALHQRLVEFVAESDDALLEKFFEEDGLTEEELRGSLHAAVQAQTFTPLFCTAAKSNVGVTRLLDFVAKHGSSPDDRKHVEATDEKGEEVEVDLASQSTVAFIYKTLSESHLGEMSFFRIYSGKLETGMSLANTVQGSSEKIGGILLPNGKDRETVDHLSAGDIGALVKLKGSHTNDTLCSQNFKVKLPAIEYPAPVMHCALEITSKGDAEKIAEGLALIHEEDPSFLYRADPELSQTILSGQGDLHLKAVRETLKRRYNIDIGLAKPRVPYRETIKAPAEAKYRHKKQSGGAGQFGEVWMRIKPGERDSGVIFGHSLVGNNVDRSFVPSVEKGVRAAETNGFLSGCRIVDLEVDFYDGKQHPVDSKDIAFQIAGKMAFRDAFLNAKPCLLEPITELTVRTPEDAMGAVLGDLSSRRGKVLGMDSQGGAEVVTAQVPAREVHGYSTDLRSLTAGRGEHSEKFSHYEEMPRELEQKVIEERKKELEEAE